MGREDIFKRTIGYENLHHDRNDNGVGVVNFSTLKYLAVKITIFPHRNIHKHTLTAPDWKTCNQIDHTSIDGRWHSSLPDIRSFRGANCDTGHCLVVVKFKEMLVISEEAEQKFDVERFNLTELSVLEVRKQYQINRFAVSENLNDSKDINRTWENFKENIKTLAKDRSVLYELKQHKPWFDE